MKKKYLIMIFVFFSATFFINAATITVTNENDNGSGSLRQLIADANSGDTIVFAPTVKYIILTSGQIGINKDLTIDAGNDANAKVTISGNENSSIFVGGRTANINNLILTKSKESSVYINNGTFTATNCIFTENLGNSGGAVNVSNGTFIAENCIFVRNLAYSGGAINAHHSGTFIAVNCTFAENFADYNGAIFIGAEGSIACIGYLYHCTFDNNKAANSNNGITNFGTLYSYNCIYTGDTPQIVSSGINTIFAGNNLIEGENGVTRYMVFGSNEFDATVGYITPLPFAKTATRLDNSIQIPIDRWEQQPIITADEIFAKLATDQAGNPRSDTGFVTYGAIEIKEVSVNASPYLATVSVFPNPTTDFVTVSFELENSCNLQILLCDILGQEVLQVYDGFTVEGNFSKTINVNNLDKGVYFLKILIDGNATVEKIIRK